MANRAAAAVVAVAVAVATVAIRMAKSLPKAERTLVPRL
jgi:hypothetical protein